MDGKMLKNIYLTNGINDFKLRSQEDLLKVHGIKVEQIKGFDELGDIQKKIFKGFILNFFNGCGLDLRATFEPVAVDFVHETSYYYVGDDGDNYDAGEKREIILKNGELILESHRKVDEEELEGKEVKHFEPQDYLRFKYYERGNKYSEDDYVSWLHVYSEESYG